MNKFKPGDRVRINNPHHENHGELATVVQFDAGAGYYELWLDEPLGHGVDCRRWYREEHYLELIHAASPTFYLVSPVFMEATP